MIQPITTYMESGNVLTWIFIFCLTIKLHDTSYKPTSTTYDEFIFFFLTETTLELAVANSNNFDYGSADYSRNGLIALSISLPMHFNALMIRFDENIYSTCFYLPITYSCILPHLYFLQWFCLSFCTEITSQPSMCGIFRHRLRYWAIYNGQVHLLFMRNLCYI